MNAGLQITRGDRRFFLLTIGLIVLAHATAYLTHEYAHATTAWLLGWMRSPIGIDYGRASLANLLFQQDVGDGMDYALLSIASQFVVFPLATMACLAASLPDRARSQAGQNGETPQDDAAADAGDREAQRG